MCSDQLETSASRVYGVSYGRVRVSADPVAAVARRTAQRPRARRHGGDPDPSCGGGEVSGSAWDFGVGGVRRHVRTCRSASRPRRRRRPQQPPTFKQASPTPRGRPRPEPNGKESPGIFGGGEEGPGGVSATAASHRRRRRARTGRNSYLCAPASPPCPTTGVTRFRHTQSPTAEKVPRPPAAARRAPAVLPKPSGEAVAVADGPVPVPVPVPVSALLPSLPPAFAKCAAAGATQTLGASSPTPPGDPDPPPSVRS